MKKKNKHALIALVVISTVAIVVWQSGLIGKVIGKEGILTPHYVTSDGKTGTLSIIGGVPNIVGIYFTLKITNTGEIPLETSLESAEPVELFSAFTVTGTVQPGETKTWVSTVLDTRPYDSLTGASTIFKVRVKQSFTCPYGYVCKQSDGTTVTSEMQGVIYQEGMVSLLIEPDVAGVSSTIEFGESVGEPSGGTTPTCLTSGTSCVANADCCSGICQAEQLDTFTVFHSGSNEKCRWGGVGKCAASYAYAECSSSCEYCELWKDGALSKTYDSTEGICGETATATSCENRCYATETINSCA